MAEHVTTIAPEPDSDGLINWRCTCGVQGQDYDIAEAHESVDAHTAGHHLHPDD